MTPQETEIRNRILLSVAAYAYEYEDTSIITDADYDTLAKKIDPNMETGNAMLDIFFREEYTPDSGMWVHKHPQKDRLKKIYGMVYKGERY